MSAVKIAAAPARQAGVNLLSRVGPGFLAGTDQGFAAALGLLTPPSAPDVPAGSGVASDPADARLPAAKFPPLSGGAPEGTGRDAADTSLSADASLRGDTSFGPASGANSGGTQSDRPKPVDSAAVTLSIPALAAAADIAAAAIASATEPPRPQHSRSASSAGDPVAVAVSPSASIAATGVPAAPAPIGSGTALPAAPIRQAAVTAPGPTRAVDRVPVPAAVPRAALAATPAPAAAVPPAAALDTAAVPDPDTSAPIAAAVPAPPVALVPASGAAPAASPTGALTGVASVAVPKSTERAALSPGAAAPPRAPSSADTVEYPQPGAEHSVGPMAGAFSGPDRGNLDAPPRQDIMRAALELYGPETAGPRFGREPSPSEPPGAGENGTVSGPLPSVSGPTLPLADLSSPPAGTVPTTAAANPGPVTPPAMATRNAAAALVPSDAAVRQPASPPPLTVVEPPLLAARILSPSSGEARLGEASQSLDALAAPASQTPLGPEGRSFDPAAPFARLLPGTPIAAPPIDLAAPSLPFAADDGAVALVPPRNLGSPQDGAAAASRSMVDGAASGTVSAAATAGPIPAPTADNSPPVSVEALPHRLSEQLVQMASGAARDVVLQLHPPELGAVTVRVMVAGHDVSAWFASPQPQVQQAISQAIGQLQTDLGNAGYNLNGAWVGGQDAAPRGRNGGGAPAARAVTSEGAAAPAGGYRGRRDAAASGVSVYV